MTIDRPGRIAGAGGAPRDAAGDAAGDAPGSAEGSVRNGESFMASPHTPVPTRRRAAGQAGAILVPLWHATWHQAIAETGRHRTRHRHVQEFFSGQSSVAAAARSSS